MKRWLIMFLGFLMVHHTQLSAQDPGYFEFTPEIVEAYNHAKNFHFTQAEQIITLIKNTQPGNKLVYLIENYLDFYQIFILEDKKLFSELEKNKKSRLEEIKKGNPHSPYYLFCEAEINIQWAIARLKFDEKLKAAAEMYRAYGLLEKNKKKHPDFIYSDKSLSFIHVLAESLPGLIRKIFQVQGSIDQGTEEISRLYQTVEKQPTHIFFDEITIIYAYILYYQNNEKEKAFQLIKKHYFPDNLECPIVRFVAANLAQKMGQTDLAIEILDKPYQQEPEIPFDYLQFLKGKWRLYRLDEGANIYLENFINQFAGQHYLKEAYQKLAWYHLVIKENLAGYKKYMHALKNNGNTLVDEDKQAEEERKKENIPHPILLKARLLYDGGYFQRAYDLLIKNAVIFDHDQEYTYRMGRITQALKNYPESLTYFQEVISSKNIKSYFACNAALQMALIYEDQRLFEKALESYEKCLSLDPDKYKNSIHQKAKAGRQRVREKLD